MKKVVDQKDDKKSNVEKSILDYRKLKAIQITLREKLLPIKGTNLLSEITKNLILVDKEVEKIDLRLLEINKQFTDKNENGKDKRFKVITMNNQQIFDLDEDGNFQEVDENYNGTWSTRVKSNEQEYIDTIETLEKDKVEIKFEKFDRYKFKDLVKKGKFDGIDLTPLVGFIIDIDSL